MQTIFEALYPLYLLIKPIRTIFIKNHPIALLIPFLLIVGLGLISFYKPFKKIFEKMIQSCFGNSFLLVEKILIRLDIEKRLQKIIPPTKIVTPLVVITSFILLGIKFYLVYKENFPFIFGLRDIGYFYHLHVLPIADGDISIILFPLITHYLGFLFSHKLASYHLASFLLLAFATFIYVLGLKRLFLKQNAAFWMILTLIFITQFSTAKYVHMILEYNVFGIVCALGWAGSMLLYLHAHNNSQTRGREIPIILIVFWLILGLLGARASYGVILALSSVVLLSTIPNDSKRVFQLSKKGIQISVLIGFCVTIVIGFILIAHLSVSQKILHFSRQIKESGLISLSQENLPLFTAYLKSITHFLMREVLPQFFLCLLFYYIPSSLLKAKQKFPAVEKILQGLTICVLYLSCIFPVFQHVISYLIGLHSEYPNTLQYPFIQLNVVATFIVVTFFYMHTISKTNKQNIHQLLYLLIICIIGSLNTFGTDGRLISGTINVSGLWAGIFGILWYMTNDHLKQTKMLFILVITLIFFGFPQPYNKKQVNPKSFVSSTHPLLKGIHIEASHERVLNKLKQILDTSKFDFKKDLIFAYHTLPGLLSPFKIKALGESYHFGNEPKRIQRSILHLKYQAKKLSKQPKKKVYLLTIDDHPIPIEIQEVLFSIIQPSTDIQETSLGVLMHPYISRTRKHFNVSLKGPYIIR